MSGFDGGQCSECGGTDGMHYSDCTYDGTGSGMMFILSNWQNFYIGQLSPRI